MWVTTLGQIVEWEEPTGAGVPWEQIRDDERTTQRLYVYPCLSQGLPRVLTDRAGGVCSSASLRLPCAS